MVLILKNLFTVVVTMFSAPPREVLTFVDELLSVAKLVYYSQRGT